MDRRGIAAKQMDPFDCDNYDRRVLGFEQKLKETKDTMMGEVGTSHQHLPLNRDHQVRALLVSRTYATREDLSRAIAQDKQHQVSAGFLQSSLPSHCYHVTMISLFPSTIIPVQETRWH